MQEVFFVFQLVDNQVIVGGLGDIIGLNHIALHEALKMLGYTGDEYKKIFLAVNYLASYKHAEIRKYKSDVKQGPSYAHSNK